MLQSKDLFLGGDRWLKKTFSSSTIDKAEYDTILKELNVWFKNGTQYQYKGIPVEVVENFFKATSAGKFINEEIIKNYKSFKKIETKEDIKND